MPRLAGDRLESLKLLREVKPEELFPPKEREAPLLDVLRAQLTQTRQEIATLTKDLAQGYSAAVSAVLRQQEEKETQLKEALSQEQAKAARPVGRDWGEFRDLAAALASAKDPEDARLRLRAALQRRVREIMVRVIPVGEAKPPRRDKLRVVQVWFNDSDVHRDYAVYYRPAANRPCKGGYGAKSLAGMGKYSNLDLRNPEHAKRLQVFDDRKRAAPGGAEGGRR